ncbi:alpha/beta hydrolase family protein [Luteitalea sp.]|jgi:alpha-beta hydrolase superfamily lysophospholipase|uniref:alpha/beta hydrolase family protein n=1 Tax=Luteitalea sp. TaxID=2004800 RepID=UPI0037C8F311
MGAVLRHYTCLVLALAAAWHASPAAAQQAAEDWTATYRIVVQGRNVGSEQVSVVRDAEGLVIRSSGGIAGGGYVLRSAEMVYGPTGAPLRLRTEARLKDQPLIVDTTVADGKARNAVTQGETATEVTHPIAADAIFLPNNVFAAAQGLAYRVNALPAGAKFALYVAPQAQVIATLSAVADERMQTAAGMFELRRHAIDIDNAGTPMVLLLWAEKATGRMVRYSITAAGVDVVREDLTSVFTREVKEFRENDQTLLIPALGFNIGATVSRPAGKAAPGKKDKNVEKLPAVVLVGGSGNIDRDTIAFGVPVMGQLAGHLADAGYLVVRYDKRGVGQSGGRAESATLSDYADDVLSVVKWLREQKDVDDKRIVVVGHSEGGAVALLAATRTGDLRAIVAIAAPGVKGSELVLEQQRTALDGLKLAADEKQRRVDLQKQVMNAVITGQGWDGIPEAMRKQADTAWFRSFLMWDPAPVMKKVDEPLLILHGALDKQVPLQNAEVLNGLALQRKKGTTTLVMVPGINHLLVPAKTGEVSEYGSLQGAKVSPDVAKQIVDWLTQLPAR